MAFHQPQGVNCSGIGRRQHSSTGLAMNSEPFEHVNGINARRVAAAKPAQTSASGLEESEKQPLLNVLEQAFETGNHSDLTVTCHGRVFKVHKMVVCAQSEWFAKACQENGFRESTSGVIDLPFDDPPVVKAMLQYLYTFDYSVPDDLEETIAYAQARSRREEKMPLREGTSSIGPRAAEPSRPLVLEPDHNESRRNSDAQVENYGSYGGDQDLTGADIDPAAMGIGSHRPQAHANYLWRMHHRMQATRVMLEDTQTHQGLSDEIMEDRETAPLEYDERALPPMLFHINVYALADRIQHQWLKQAAERKFEQMARKQWRSPDFPAVIEAIYEVAPPGSTGNSLRMMITRLVASHAKELFTLDRGFADMLQNTPDFAADLAKALSGAGAEPNYDVEELCCPMCKLTFKMKVNPGLTALTCPVCKSESIVARWRLGRREASANLKKRPRRSVMTGSWEL